MKIKVDRLSSTEARLCELLHKKQTVMEQFIYYSNINSLSSDYSVSIEITSLKENSSDQFDGVIDNKKLKGFKSDILLKIVECHARELDLIDSEIKQLSKIISRRKHNV